MRNSLFYVLLILSTSFACQKPEAPTLQDLMAPEAAVVKLAGDMKFTEGPVWKVDGVCDGMCVDALGNIYTTAREGISVLSPDGKLIGTIELPESPSNCCFGGDDYKTLFITARTSLYSVELANSGDR
jgi:hypothetical protein